MSAIRKPMNQVRGIRYMDIAEFRREGYLHEVNRRFFHPLGLALEVLINEDGSQEISGIWDFREDPEGVIYDETALNPELIERVRQIEEERKPQRLERLGYWVQLPPAPRE